MMIVAARYVDEPSPDFPDGEWGLWDTTCDDWVFDAVSMPETVAHTLVTLWED